MKHFRKNNENGFTLIEVVITIIIAGILAAIAFRSGSVVYYTAALEETRQELDALAIAIVGNPELKNNGTRCNFGYVGDVGAMPPNLDALVANPGGYGTWKGPYIRNRFSQISDDYKKDAWGEEYDYTGDNTITAQATTTGGGGGGGCGGGGGGGSTTGIIRKLAGSVDELLQNSLSGNIFDIDGTPPGSQFMDSVRVYLTHPNGSGSTTTKSASIDEGGYFSFDNIPIGNHDLDIVYLPDNDTLNRFVTILPNSQPYNEYYLENDVW